MVDLGYRDFRVREQGLEEFPCYSGRCTACSSGCQSSGTAMKACYPFSVATCIQPSLGKLLHVYSLHSANLRATCEPFKTFKNLELILQAPTGEA